MLTAEHLRELLRYDQETGAFSWRVVHSHRMRVGERAGQAERGRRRIEINGRRYFEHRLAWLWMTGDWPRHTVDHRDRDPSNNRWSNLREATARQQQENKSVNKHHSTGFLGVVRVRYWNNEPPVYKYRAQICVDSKMRYLGFFDDFEAAKAARLEAEGRLFTHSTRVG